MHRELESIPDEYLIQVLTGNVAPDGDMFVKFARIIAEVKLAAPSLYVVDTGFDNVTFKDRAQAEKYCLKNRGFNITGLYAMPQLANKRVMALCPKCSFPNGINPRNKITMCYKCGNSFDRSKTNESVKVKI